MEKIIKIAVISVLSNVAYDYTKKAIRRQLHDEHKVKQLTLKKLLEQLKKSSNMRYVEPILHSKR